MSKHIDITGQKYGMLTVLSFHSKVKTFRKWNCRCDCGKECVKYGHLLRSGWTISCGCEAKRRQRIAGQKNAIDLTGQRFGRLLVLRRNGSSEKHHKAIWLCQCDCGKQKSLWASSLKSGNGRSCGCIQKETMHKLLWNPNLTQEDREASANRQLAYPGLYQWRKAVYARDHYTCQACRIHIGKRIAAHHKEAWGTNKELRLDVGNGATSCEPCHKEFHDKYGWGENTTTQWNEFVESKHQKEKVA